MIGNNNFNLAGTYEDGVFIKQAIIANDTVYKCKETYTILTKIDESTSKQRKTKDPVNYNWVLNEEYWIKNLIRKPIKNYPTYTFSVENLETENNMEITQMYKPLLQKLQ